MSTSHHYILEPELPENTMSSAADLAASLESIIPAAGVKFIQNDDLPDGAVALSPDLYELLTSLSEAVV